MSGRETVTRGRILGLSWQTLLRLAVSAGLIAVVLSRAELGAVAEAIAGVDLGLVAAAFASYFVGYAFSVGRWSTLLSAHGAPPRFGYLYSSFMIGMFFNQILPTTVGGDFARYHYTSSLGRGAAFSAVLMDRVFGLVSLMLFALVGLIAAGTANGFAGGVFEAVAGLLALGLVALGAIFLLPDRAFERLRGLYAALPARLAGMLDKLLGVFAAYRGRLDIVLKALVLSLVLQCVVVGHYYLVGAALGFGVPLYAYVFIVPLAIVVMMLPISINGIGVRESIFVYLLGLYGAAPSAGLAFAWLVYGLILGQGLLGGVVFGAVRRARDA